LGDSENVRIVRCAFTREHATDWGGSLSIDSASAVAIDHSTFESNASQKAGAIACVDSDAEITDCVFAQNDATVGGGGAVMVWTTDSPRIFALERCDFQDNEAYAAAGAMQASGCAMTIDNCSFTNDRA